MVRVFPFVLWVLPLVFPAAGLVYVGLKLQSGDPVGPYSIALLTGSLVWCLLTIVPLCHPPWRARILRKRLALMAAYTALLIGGVLAELLLTGLDVAFDLPPCHPLSMSWWAFPPQVPPLSSTFVTDPEHGSRYDDPENPNFNSQGFRDRDEFTADSARTASGLRVLLIGDSFAFGSAAVRDGSNTGFADLLETRLNAKQKPQGVVWNTGIPGTGQREQLLHLERWLAVLKPQLVVLSLFSGNDLQDNVRPPGQFYVFADTTWANRYAENGDAGNGDTVRGLTPRDAWLRSQGYGVESQRLLLKFRTVSAAWRVISKMRRRWGATATAEKVQQQLRATGDLLGRISTVCATARVELLVLLIPKVQTLADNEDAAVYDQLRAMLGDLPVTLIDMRPRLTPQDYTPAPDEHWTKAGHRKAAAALAETIRELPEFTPAGSRDP